MQAQDRQKVLDKAVLGLFMPNGTASAPIPTPSTFLTTLYCSLRVSWSEDIPTACTDGLRLLINFDWFCTLSEKMRVTVLAHEIWHVAWMHMARVGERNFSRWNEAADYAINNMLDEHGYEFDVCDPATGKRLGLIDHRYDGLSAEEIYDRLTKDNKPIDLPFGDDFQSPAGSSTEEGELPSPTPAQIAEIMTNVVRATTLSQMNPNEAGLLPGSITQMIDNLLNPRLPWETLLSKWLTERSDQGFNWSRPNRRYQDMYLPSQGSESGLSHTFWALDVSGSVTDMQLRIFVSEMKGAKERYRPESMTVVTFDTVIQNTWEFMQEDEITGLEITGRGGTDMHEVFELVEKAKPDALIMFSDMFCEIPPKPQGVEVLWVCFDNSSWTPPYGEVIHVCSSPSIPA